MYQNVALKCLPLSCIFKLKASSSFLNRFSTPNEICFLLRSPFPYDLPLKTENSASFRTTTAHSWVGLSLPTCYIQLYLLCHIHLTEEWRCFLLQTVYGFRPLHPSKLPLLSTSFLGRVSSLTCCIQLYFLCHVHLTEEQRYFLHLALCAWDSFPFYPLIPIWLPVVDTTDCSKVLVLVQFLVCVPLWFLRWGVSCWVLSCSLFSCCPV